MIKKRSQKPKNNLSETRVQRHSSRVPKKLIRLNLNKSETAWTTSPKSQFLGFEPFLEGVWGPPSDNFEKVETRVQRLLSTVPKKLIMAKFEQTSDQGLWTMSQKSQFLGFEPFLEGSCGPQTENFGKIETRVQRHLSSCLLYTSPRPRDS